MASTPALRLSGVGFTYRDAASPALDGVDLAVHRGEMVAVVGPSGAGKSTLCLCANGLIPHFVRGTLSGRVEVFGAPTRDRTVSQLARDVGLVFQDFEAQLFSTSVELEVAFGPENFAVPPDEIRRRVAHALQTVGLTGFERREPATLSGGEKQRLAIASVLALQPGILVMDEPTTDLDPLGKESVFEVGRRLRREATTLLVVEHETEEVTAADRVVVLDGGRIVAQGPPSEVLVRSHWLEKVGVRPPGAAHLLALLGEEPILDEDEATARLRRLGRRIPLGVLEALRRRDAARSARYGDPVLVVEGLVHRYEGGVEALRGVDLVIRRGEFVAVLGQNGSGKTTLVKHFNGLLQPTAGEVRVGGQSTRRQSVSRLGRVVGYVFQNPDHQIFAETVFDEVAFGPRNHGLAPEEVHARVAEALAAVGMTGREGDDPFVLTKGERQRVAVASVLATRPQVIVLDEPTTGLDDREQRNMMELVRRLNERGHTIVCVTHSMWVAAEYAHRVVVMKDGQVWMDGTAREVFAREGDLAAARLRPPQMVRIANRLGGTLLDRREVAEVLTRKAPTGADEA
ncbi:MAG: energy-coupling factor transporter ATPase [Armatimonadota bacterium]|nr:energy-coupling factor transporter ATPase [Armatimonadota bacterium]MDR5697378.1 energy-coupling factor transporter ATPase [Armatimonadota bacterium]